MTTEAIRVAGSDATGNTVLEVEIYGSTHIRLAAGKKLLDVLLDAGIDAPYVCRESACATCICSVKGARRACS